MIALGSEDACGLAAINRSLRAVVGNAFKHKQEGDGPVKPHGIFYWGCKERVSRPLATVPLPDPPAFASAFHASPTAAVAPGVAAAAAANAVAADGDEVMQDGGGGGLNAQLLLDLPTKERLLAEEAGRARLDVLTAAALFGGWWGPAAEQDDGLARQLALAMLRDSLGGDVADAVQEVTSAQRCPAPAKGFWGVLFLGFMAATTAPAAQHGAAQLPRTLLNIGEPGSLIPANRVPVKGLEKHDHESKQDTQRQLAGRDWLLPGPSRYVTYYVREFLSALVVLLRCKDLRLQGLAESDSIAHLHYSIMQDLLLHEAAEDDKANIALQGMPGFQGQNAQLLAAAGVPSGHFLTGEQCRILRRAIPRDSASRRTAVVGINAFAGTAKSTTLKLLMHAHPDLRILYTAYNNLVVRDAEASSPLNVSCRTTHSIAYSKAEELKQRPGWTLGGSLLPSQILELLKEIPYYIQRRNIGLPGASFNQALVIRALLEVFCTSADDHITQEHMETVPRDWIQRNNPPNYVLAAQQLWNCIVSNRWGSSQSGKPFQFHHNTYLKMFVMEMVAAQRPLLDASGCMFDVILIDEAQDMNPVTLQMFMSQQCTRVLVGDRHQHIYSFNHCQDALTAAAARAGTRSFSLSSSFRLGPAIAEVANRLLWQLGERSRPIIGAGFKQAAVYVMQPSPTQAAGGDDGHGLPNIPAPPRLFEQFQVLPQPIEPTAATPLSLTTRQVSCAHRGTTRSVYLAQPPIYPATGRPSPLTFLARYNSTWVEVAAALVCNAGPGDAADNPGDQPGGHQGDAGDTAAGAVDTSSKRQKLSHNSSSDGATHSGCGTGGSAGSGVCAEGGARQQHEPPRLWLTGINPRDGKVEFLEKLDQLAQFRLGQIGYFRQYRSWKEVMEAAVSGADSDLRGAVALVEERGAVAVRSLVRSIYNAVVAHKADAAYILGTCHKAKGTEEDYVQLADDFAIIHRGMPTLEELRRCHALLDEYNLTYVAASRAKRALICNEDLRQLLKQGEMKPFVLNQVPDRGDNQVLCHACNTTFDAATAAGGAGFEVNLIHKNITARFQEALAAQGVRMARLILPDMEELVQQHINAGAADPWAAAQQQYKQLIEEHLNQPKPVCPSCAAKRSIWGQVVAGDAQH